MGRVAVVALDIHKKFSVVQEMGLGATDLRVTRVEHGSKEPMRRFFSQFEGGTDVVMEATFNWPWIAEVAEEAGLMPHLAHPWRAREMAKGMAKTDRKDAKFLGRLWLAGEIFPEAYLAPAEVRRRRDLFRQRLLLVRMRVALKNNIHGQLFRQGFVTSDEVSDLFSQKGRKVLAGLGLTEHERELLEQKLLVLDDLNAHILVLERSIEKALEGDPRAQILMSLPGVGQITAYSMLAEIGELERFPNGRALAAYAGLLPMPQESAEKEFGSRTSGQCNRFLRWAMIEAVSGAVRKSPRMKSLHTRVRMRNKKYPGKARVAVARQLLELAYLLLSRNESYREIPPRRPGSEQSIRARETDSHRVSTTPLSARQALGTRKAMSKRCIEPGQAAS